MNITLTIPTSYDDVTIEQYQRIVAALKSSESEQDKQLELLAILTGKPKQLLAKINAPDFNRIADGLSWMMMIPRMEDAPLVPIFTMNNMDYGFIPDPSRLSVGEFADLESKMDDVTGNLHEITAILYRKVKRRFFDRYEIESYSPSQEKKDAMKQAPLSAAMGGLVFFYAFETALVKLMRPYLEAKESQTSSPESGDGTASSTSSPERTS